MNGIASGITNGNGHMPHYKIHRASHPPELKGRWKGTGWHAAPAADISCFRPEGSCHRPVTRVRLLYDADSLYGLFEVRDRYVRCVHTRFQEPVFRDSCVEFFLQPRGEGGYFNFEFNCGGTLLASYITDPERTADGFREYTRLSSAEGREVRVFHSLPSTLEQEVQTEILWHLEFVIPFSLLEHHAGRLRPVRGDRWRANFYKCADGCSHPHWASWAPVDTLNFHLPRCFGTLQFV